jgi:hypothetical protein
MASLLNTKINSYRIERGIEFSEAYGLTPTQTGLNSPITFTAVGYQIAYEPTVGPPNGSGSWRFGGTEVASSSSRFFGNAMPNANDRDYSMGFWFRLANVSSNMNSFPIFTHGSAAGGGNGFTIVVNTVTSGSTFRVSIRTNGVTTDLATGLVVNQWQYISVRRDQNNIFAYHNGDLAASVTNAETTAITNTSFGAQIASPAGFDYNISNFYYTDWSSITPQIMQEIYQLGVGTDKIFNASAATASALLTEETVETTKSFEYIQNSIIATALQTGSTIVIVNYDNVEVTTSILVDAVFPNATIFVQTNISNAAAPMTASLEAPEHINIAGTGFIFSAFPATASADLLPLAFFGSGNQDLPAPALTASAVLLNPSVSIPVNYRQIVKSLLPPFYANSPDKGTASYLATWKNDGYADWGTYDVSGGVDVNSANAPYPISSIGNGKAVRGYTNANVNDRWSFIKPSSGASAFIVTPGQDYSIEAWIYTSKRHPRSFEMSFGEAELSIGGQVVEVRNEFNQVIDETYVGGFINFRTTTEVSYEHGFGTLRPEGENQPDFFIPNSWNHVVVTGKAGSYGGLNNLQTQFWINGVLRSTSTGRLANTVPSGNGMSVRVSGKGTEGDADPFDYARYFVTEVAVYDQALSNAEIIYHYDFITTLSPNRLILPDPMENVSSFLMAPTILATKNLNYPELPVVASANIANPSLEVTVGDIFDSEPFIASALMVDEVFAGDPDAMILAEPLIAYAEAGPNVYALDTKYFSYIQNIIAPHRYIPFDSPNNDKDWGSDNDYSNAAPFVYSGQITSSVDGLTNNSLLTDGLNYTTSGVILKESEWDDDWGTGLGSYHSSYWIKRSTDDIGNNALRIIQSAFSPADDAFAVLYQYQNNIHFQIFNGTDYFTASSTIGVNVFDYSKHHIVVNFSKTGTNHFVTIYVDKQIVISQNVGPDTLAFRNSDTFLAPNTETNNFARMSVGALIVPIELISIPVNPTPTKMYIDEVHWAQTSITQQGVIDLYDEMPFKNPITWFADPMLSLTSEFIDPTFGVGSGIDSVPATANADIVVPSLELQLQPVVIADIMEASGEAVEPFSVIADNITNIEIVSDIFVASSELLGGGVVISIPGPTMYASAVLVTKTPYFDPYHLLVFQQSRLPLSTSFAGRWGVGDID